MDLHGIAGECYRSLHAKTVRVSDFEAKFPRVALSAKRQSKQCDSDLKKLTQSFELGSLHDTSRSWNHWITKGITDATKHSFLRVFTKYRHRFDKTRSQVGQLLIQILRVGWTSIRPRFQDRSLHALRHQEAWGKTGACTAGGAGAVLSLHPNCGTGACLNTGAVCDRTTASGSTVTILCRTTAFPFFVSAQHR